MDCTVVVVAAADFLAADGDDYAAVAHNDDYAAAVDLDATAADAADAAMHTVDFYDVHEFHVAVVDAAAADAAIHPVEMVDVDAATCNAVDAADIVDAADGLKHFYQPAAAVEWKTMAVAAADDDAVPNTYVRLQQNN